MSLQPEPFQKIQEGTKSLELRLFDEKRQSIDPGDTIIFQKDPEHDEQISTTVLGLVRYPSFADLLEDFPPEVYLGHTEKSNEEIAAGMARFYSEEEQATYGVVGIRIKSI